MTSTPEAAVPGRRRRRVLYLALALGASLVGCRRMEQGVFVVAPFNDETKIAKVVATWQPAAPGVHFQVRVENRLADRLYVRLKEFRLTDKHGASLGASTAAHECIVEAGATALALEGDVVGANLGEGSSAGFDLDRFGVPLSERGRGIYREFLLQSQNYTAAQVDAELDTYEKAPPCR